MTDLSKRANLQGVREVRGLVLDIPGLVSPTQVVESEWAPLVRADIESEDSEFWRYVGEASIVDHAYTVRDVFGEFQETIRGGAFDTSLSQNPAVMHNYMHEPLTMMSTTRGGGLTLTASPHLAVRSLIQRSNPLGQMYMPAVANGDATSMSFAFRVTHQTWNDDYTERDITGVNLHLGDVASIISGYGANPPAWGTVRSAAGADAALLALRAGTASPDQLQMLAGIVCGAIDMADDAFDTFLDALGIPDPDAVEDEAEVEQTSALDPDFLKELVAVQLRSRTI